MEELDIAICVFLYIMLVLGLIAIFCVGLLISSVTQNPYLGIMICFVLLLTYCKGLVDAMREALW